MMTHPTTSPPRPRTLERKQRILDAAAMQFWRHGYHQVSMAGIAAEVGIGASALYRHFTGKHGLLLAVFDQQLTRLEAATDSPTTDVIAGFADHLIAHQEFGVLWERELGNLAVDEQELLRRRISMLFSRIPTVLEDEAETRALAVLSVLDSTSYYRQKVDRSQTRSALVAAAEAVRGAHLPPKGCARVGGVDGLSPTSRREALLAVAVRLFAERGYPSVALDDIGAAIGIAGPSVYKHFASKIDVLDAALNRGNEALWLGLNRAFAGARDPSDAVDRLADDYARFAVTNPNLISILVSEIIYLPAERRAAYRRAQRDYLMEWSNLLQEARTDGDGDTAAMLVRATTSLINSLARAQDLRTKAGHQGRTAALAKAVLHS